MNGELLLRLLQVRLRCVDRGDQRDPDLPAEIFQTVIFRRGDGVGLCQQQKPITGLVGFLQGDLQLGNEIRDELFLSSENIMRIELYYKQKSSHFPFYHHTRRKPSAS